MIVLFFSLFITIILLILCMISLSTLKISIKGFSASNYDKITKEFAKKDFYVSLNLYLLKKIKIFGIKLNNHKIKRICSKQNIDKVSIDKIKEYLPDRKHIVKDIRKLNIKISELKLNLTIGTEDVIITSALVYLISVIISIFVPRLIKEYKEGEILYSIIPIYKNKNLYKLDLDCIISVEMVHIIYMIYIILKRKRVDNNGRASNRRTYGYSYE